MQQDNHEVVFAGGCLCGAVRFASSAPVQLAGHCHCTDCRRSSGTGHSTHAVVPEEALTLTGSVTYYESAADSGNRVSRGFCGTCGSPLLSRNSAMPGMAFVRASALDDPEIIRPQMTVYASRAPSWDKADPTLPAFATMPHGGASAAIAEGSGTA
jgi:hypothetical protein